MEAIAHRRTREETARLGTDLYVRHVTPSLRPEDEGRFVAIDVDSGAYEVDDDDAAAVHRLRAKVGPEADVWLEWVGQPGGDQLGLR